MFLVHKYWLLNSNISFFQIPCFTRKKLKEVSTVSNYKFFLHNNCLSTHYIIYYNKYNAELPVAVSYNRKKLRLKWEASGVTVNPELKLLQYDIGKPAVFENTVDYMLEKNGMTYLHNWNLIFMYYLAHIWKKFNQ